MDGKHATVKTRSSATADWAHDAIRQSKTFKLLHNCRKVVAYSKSTTNQSKSIVIFGGTQINLKHSVG